MIIKIHLTAMIFAALAWLFISTVRAQDIPVWAAASVLTTFVISLLATILLTLYRIWA